VPRDELADVLWGDAPPATWGKALSVLVSKLRTLLVESGIHGSSALTAAFGCYRLDLPDGTWVDVLAAATAAKEAEEFLAANELAKAATAATLAETLTHGRFLAGDDGPWVEAKRRELADVRARALGSLAEASFGSGNSAEAVRWAELAIDAEPFRESGYRRLMEAHIGAGNRAEALQVYERCRRLLADELGAYPSPETESVYRDLLAGPTGRRAAKTSDSASAEGETAGRTAFRRRPGLVVIAVAAAAIAVGAAITALVARGDGAGAPSAAGMPRVALVVPRAPGGIATDDASVAPYLSALEQARGADDVKTKIFAIDPSRHRLPRQISQSIGSFGLVLLAGELVDDRFAHVMARHPHTRFAVIDPPNATTNNTPLYRAVSRDANATDVFFSTGPAAYLAGYLTGLMRQRRDTLKRQVVVSIIVSDPTLNQNEVDGFVAGVNAANPDVLVRVDQTHDSPDPLVCERIANREIDARSTTVYADAGATCNAGALSAAEDRDVWAIASDPAQRGPQILVSAVKRIGRAAGDVITRYLEGTLPKGHFDVGIERQDVAIVNLNKAVPARIRARLTQVKEENMASWAAYETPLR
jgi:basic membrane lipoprotein Med (substrate-binding protein (PBP1-ABC) superfamily)/DNA-binding SARP family transcriptional activator